MLNNVVFPDSISIGDASRSLNNRGPVYMVSFAVMRTSTGSLQTFFFVVHVFLVASCI